MATKTVSIVATVDPLAGLPSNIKALYQRIITASGVERADWNDAGEDCGIRDKSKATPDCPMGPPVSEDAKRRKARSAAFTALKMQSDLVFDYCDSAEIWHRVPRNELKVGTDMYKAAKAEAQSHFSKCIGRALVRLGFRDAPTRAATGSTGDANKGNATPLASDAPNGLDAHFGQVAGIVQELLARVSGVQAGMLAFQTSHKLTKSATEAFGSISADVTTLAGSIGKLSELIVSGTTAEQAAKDLAAAMPAPTTEPADEPATVQ